MIDFSWISNEEFCQTICEDWKEAQLCQSVKAHKGAQILLGSVLEGILLYALERSRQNQKKGDSLHRLLQQAQESGLLRSRDVHLGHAIRDTRNLVHPEKYIKEGQKATSKETDLLQQVSIQIIEQLKSKLEKFLQVGVNAYVEKKEKRFSIKTNLFKLGRGEENDLVLASGQVSQEQAWIVYREGEFFLQDKESTNGSFIRREEGWKRIISGGEVVLGHRDYFALGGKEEELCFGRI